MHYEKFLEEGDLEVFDELSEDYFGEPNPLENQKQSDKEDQNAEGI